MTCTVDGCDVGLYALGLCEKHYARQRRHGGTHDKRAMTGDPRARFEASVDRTPTGPLGCHLWTKGLNGNGYGLFKVGGVARGAHVVAVEFDGREVPKGFDVDHICEVHHCVNPAHLEVVTHRENMRRWMDRREARGLPRHPRTRVPA